MTIGIVLLLVCVASIIIVWAGLGGIEVNGSLAAGMICLLVGGLGLSDYHDFGIQFWVSVAFVLIGAIIFLSSIRSRKALKDFSAALCVAIALISGFYAIHYLA